MEETSKRRKEALGDMGPLWTDGHDGAGCSEEAICFMDPCSKILASVFIFYPISKIIWVRRVKGW